jgi:heptosyltransferase I
MARRLRITKPGIARGARGSFLLRFLDRNVGIPIVLALGLFRARARQLPDAVRYIGILETAAIGDTALLSAVIFDLRKKFPSARIVLFAGHSNYEVARLLGDIDEVVRLKLVNVFSACQAVRREWFDVFLDFGPWPRVNAIISFLARAGYKVGFRTEGEYRHYVYDRCVLHSGSKHELENFRDVMRAIHVTPAHQPGFRGALDTDKVPSKYWPTRDYVVFHLWPGGYRSYLKEWPLDRWIELGGALISLGFDIALTGAPSEREANDMVIAQACKKSDKRNWVNCAGATIQQTLAILGRARLAVCVNTGIMHLAAILDAPVVGLHGPTSVARWGPVGKRAVALSAPAKTCGYLNLGFEYPRHCDCMHRITVQQVLGPCLRLLQHGGN